MFHFSDDIDEDDLENVLNISTTQAVHEKQINNENNSIILDEINPVDSNITLNDQDDDLILSAFDNVNNSDAENLHFSTDLSSPKNCVIPRKEVFHNSQIAQSSKNADIAISSVAKHSFPGPSEAPISAKYSKIEYERKFPGPAGLIAKKSKENIIPGEEPSPLKKCQYESQTGDLLFDNSPPWQELFKDLNVKSNKLPQIVKEFTISNVKRLNLVKHSSWKIPVFATVIYNVDSSVCDPSVTLKDHSGEIRGNLHKDLWEQCNHLLLAGSALLLRQVSVMSMINSRKLYLNITTNNIVTIYTPPTDDKQPLIITHLTPLSENDFLSEATTEKNTTNARLANRSISKLDSSLNSCPNTVQRSNEDLLDLIHSSKVSNLPNVCNSRNVLSMKSSLPNINSNSLPVNNSIPSATLKSNTENNSSLVLSELEGLDAESLFDDF